MAQCGWWVVQSGVFVMQCVVGERCSEWCSVMGRWCGVWWVGGAVCGG